MFELEMWVCCGDRARRGLFVGIFYVSILSVYNLRVRNSLETKASKPSSCSKIMPYF